MLTSLNGRLHRHRRAALCALAVLAIAAGAIATGSVLAHCGAGEHPMSGGAAICVALGGALAITGVAAFRVRHVLQRPTWRMARPMAPPLAPVAVASGVLVRAGPPPQLQVFRL